MKATAILPARAVRSTSEEKSTLEPAAPVHAIAHIHVSLHSGPPHKWQTAAPITGSPDAPLLPAAAAPSPCPTGTYTARRACVPPLLLPSGLAWAPGVGAWLAPWSPAMCVACLTFGSCHTPAPS